MSVRLPPDERTPLERELGALNGALSGFIHHAFPLAEAEEALTNAGDHVADAASANNRNTAASALSAAAIDCALGAYRCDIRTGGDMNFDDIPRNIRARAEKRAATSTAGSTALDEGLNGVAKALARDEFDLARGVSRRRRGRCRRGDREMALVAK